MKKTSRSSGLSYKPRVQRVLSVEDKTLWEEVAKSVAPLSGKMEPTQTEKKPEEPPPAPQDPEIPSSNKDTPIVPSVAKKTVTLPPLAGLERPLLRAISKGQHPLEGRLDLHGMRQNEAHQALIAFLYQAHHRGAKLVLVITGKGDGNQAFNEKSGVLRRLVPHWLADPVLRNIVLGFENANPRHGGAGALYIRLRRSSRLVS